jgi:hypothetical protein
VLVALLFALPLVPHVSPAAVFDAGKPEVWAVEMVRAVGWESNDPAVSDKCEGGPQFLVDFERTPLVDDVAHYRFDLRFGPGEYDVVRIHRVVRETRPYRPIRTRKNLFLLHGDGLGFVKFVFGTETPYLPPEQSLAVYLALNDVDVWGMDQPWALVPYGETDFTFGADWGMQFNVDALDQSLAVARVVRRITSVGSGRLNLLGYSSGGTTAYAQLNAESQRPPGLRNVGGAVILDVNYKYDTSLPEFEQGRQNVCEIVAYYQSLLDGGEYNLGFGGFFRELGYLAETAPDDPSPYYPGFTNLEATLFIGSVPDPVSFNPWYHYVAGIFEGGQPVPVDLAYTSVGSWLDFMQEFAVFEPVKFGLDYATILCDEVPNPWDGHLADIDVPILYFGANGGFGRTGFYTLDLLGSTDKTIVNISLSPPEPLDFAHIDLLTADNTLDVVWPNMLEWIEAHAAGFEQIETAFAPTPDGHPLRIAPNPGRSAGTYTVSFGLPVSGRVVVEIYDVAGRRVAVPLTAELPVGDQRVVWDGRARDGQQLAPGVYFARVRTPDRDRTARFVHLR